MQNVPQCTRPCSSGPYSCKQLDVNIAVNAVKQQQQLWYLLNLHQSGGHLRIQGTSPAAYPTLCCLPKKGFTWLTQPILICLSRNFVLGLRYVVLAAT